MEQNTFVELLELLNGFTSLSALEVSYFKLGLLYSDIIGMYANKNNEQVDIPGPLGESAVGILESLPNLSVLNAVNAAKIFESGKHVIDSMLPPRLPEWSSEEPLADRVINAMWLYLMTYRLADEEKIDETSVW